MLLDEIQEAKEKYLSCVKPKYIELYGELDPDILFIGKSLLEHGFNEIKENINAEIIFVDEYGHIAWHKKKHINDLVSWGKDGSEDIGYGFTDESSADGKRPVDIFSDVFCDFEIKAYIEQSK